jgi:hypothetical protein
MKLGTFTVKVTNSSLRYLADETSRGDEYISLEFMSAKVYLESKETYSGHLIIHLGRANIKPLQASMFARMLDPYPGAFTLKANGQLGVDSVRDIATIDVSSLREVTMTADPEQEKSKLPQFLRNANK